ncbi:hypothetical protein Pint_01661 [Pistacia integerrima]|uniref:Uncharacterized protein n=1 Tax=Pistacia integerrima TaxID=434235 RepID=A0ACC0ZII1_9ROSI|nr:hypothetical protein Pint_01661 [Pistacia integerrima]
MPCCYLLEYLLIRICLFQLYYSQSNCCFRSLKHTIYIQIVVYPQVKVRQQEQDDRGSFLFIRVIESLSLQDHHSSDEENKSNSSPSVAKITKVNAPIVKAQSVTPSKAAKSNRQINKDTKLLNARASSVTRPRAVLSSPDNDGMIGNINKFDNERSSSLKKLHHDAKVPTQTAAVFIPIKGFTARSPLVARKGSRDAFGNNSGLTQSKSAKPVVPRRKASLKKEIKSSSTGI